jgi:hypothetical protein
MGLRQRRVGFVQVVGLVVVATLLQACSGDDDGRAKPSDDGEVTTTGSTQTPVTVQQAPDGIAEFVARGTRPGDCPDLTEVPEQVSDPRAKWFISSRTVHAVDGFVSPVETVWVVTPPPAADGTGASVLYTDVGSGPTSVDLDRPMVSVTRADDGGLYGISLGNDGTTIVSIAQDGTTSPVVELPDMPLAGSLLVVGGSYYLLDLTGFIEVDGPASVQGVPVLAKASPDGRVEHLGVESSGAYAGLVDGVSLTSGTVDGVEVESPSGEKVARAPFPGRYVGEQTWMIPAFSLSDAIVVGDGRIIGCANGYGTTEIGVYQARFGLGH